MNEKARLEEILNILNKHHFLKDKSPENIRTIFEELGPSFVKIGQILSSRNDYLPNDYCIEFKKLLNDVKPIPFNEIMQSLNNEYKDVNKVFKKIDEKPLGSASIAQTHKATLINGDIVAIKVSRSNIREMINLDFKLMKKIVKDFHLNKVFTSIADINSALDELQKSMNEEMNFLTEADHIEEFAKLNKDINYIKPIKVYREYTTKNVLVMEYIGGYNIIDKTSLSKDGYDMHELGEKLANNYIKQAIFDGFYHADPHASNLKVLDGKIVYLDFGMMGRLTKESRKALEECIFYIIINNYKEIAHELILINTNDIPVDNMILISDIKSVLEHNKTSEIASVNIKKFINEMYKMLNDNHIILPNDIVMLTRGIVVIAGLLEQISPDISLALVFKNYYKSNLKSFINKDDLDKVLLELSVNSKDLIDIPNELLATLKGINNNDLRFNVELSNSNKLSSNMSTMIHQLIIALIDASLIIGMSIITLSGKRLTLIFYIYLICSIICTCYLTYKILSNKISRKK
jgi:ubiquinone biosynthesis protein